MKSLNSNSAICMPYRLFGVTMYLFLTEKKLNIFLIIDLKSREVVE